MQNITAKASSMTVRKVKCMRAVVVEGGGLRCAFAAGVLDALIEEDELDFDFYIGVSAGAIMLANALSGQKRRAINVMQDERVRAAFSRINDWIRGGDLIDLDEIWDASEDIEKLDIAHLFNHLRGEFIIVTSDVEKGVPHAITVTRENLQSALQATSALPLLVRNPIEIAGFKLLDGGITNPLPVDIAIEKGAKEILVIRSRPPEYRKSSGIEKYIGKWFFKALPELAKALSTRYKTYNNQVEMIENQNPKSYELQQIQPQEDLRSSRTSASDIELMLDYLNGFRAGKNWCIQRKQGLQERRIPRKS